MRITNFAAVLAGLSAASSALASDWSMITTDTSGSMIYVDKESIKRAGDSASAWFRADHSQDKTRSARQTKQLVRFRCMAQEMAISTIVTYAADGRVTYSNTTPELLLSYTPAVPDTVGADMLAAACA